MNKRIISFIIAALMCLALSGCTEPVPEPGEKLEPQAVPNPVRQLEREEIYEETGIMLPAPEDGENMSWSIIDAADTNPVCQLKLTLDGNEYCFRVQDISGISVSDISGMYYNWTMTESSYILNYPGQIYLTDTAGYIKWVDPNAARQYSLSMNDGADRELLRDTALLLFELMPGLEE